MLTSLESRLQVWFLILHTFVVTSLLGAHYGRLYRPPNRAEMNTRVKHYSIVPDVLDRKQNLTFIHVQYRQTVTVILGTKVLPQVIEDPPSNITWRANQNNLHTLLFIDPDHPIKKPKTENQFAHWLVGNIPGKDIEKGETIFEYVGYRAPIKDEGPHRYVFLLYRQPNKEPIVFDEPRLNNRQAIEREKKKPNNVFTARLFAKKYNLTNIGVNFFLCYHTEIWESAPIVLD